jgi:uncharacterized membrane protein
VKNKRDKADKSKIRRIYQIVVSIILLGLLWYLGFPPYYIGIMAVLIIFLIFIRGRLYRGIEKFMDKIFPFLLKFKPVTRKVIIIVIFILVWILLKQIIFFILNLAGVDMQGIANNVSQSMTPGSSSSGGVPK